MILIFLFTLVPHHILIVCLSAVPNSKRPRRRLWTSSMNASSLPRMCHHSHLRSIPSWPYHHCTVRQTFRHRPRNSAIRSRCTNRGRPKRRPPQSTTRQKSSSTGRQRNATTSMASIPSWRNTHCIKGIKWVSESAKYIVFSSCVYKDVAVSMWNDCGMYRVLTVSWSR